MLSKSCQSCLARIRNNRYVSYDLSGTEEKNMFVSGKKKPLAQVFREVNSRNRFVSELSKNEDKLFNSSFDSIQSSGKKPNLKQTQICVRRSLKRPHEPFDTFTTADKLETKTELFLMPMPKVKVNDERVKLNATVCVGDLRGKANALKEQSSAQGDEITEMKRQSDHLMDNQRNMKVFVGNVGFVAKTTKLYPKINALWDVYGKVMKISKGKHRFEQFLLIRNIEDSGPILQCTYFDFNKTLDNITAGSNVRMVGKTSGFNCLRIFRIEVYDKHITQSNFMRLQNVNSFVLLQHQNSSEESK